ncbi:hypothetical protein BCR37DRAFT_388604 [Protomyces lactucae-debilis]|uniref:Uncharacterized protein n=1 Tax=Protomyces lactucae-debilis TaxID=2754530 RepID=A0A1Y2F551_PROLT|nr:uncharacterized protein BCR37DRAFT_388604 [Protomyces lactucae-debilis]ORY78989.1 hypothetical protein BCR37DRAFT_388604 [Protomyces lactucae-debilis]
MPRQTNAVSCSIPRHHNEMKAIRVGSQLPMFIGYKVICKLLFCMLRYATSSTVETPFATSSQLYSHQVPPSTFQELSIKEAMELLPPDALNAVVQAFGPANDSSFFPMRAFNHSNDVHLPVLQKRNLRIPDFQCWEHDPPLQVSRAWCVPVRPRDYILECVGDGVGIRRDSCFQGEVCIENHDPDMENNQGIACLSNSGEVEDARDDEDITAKHSTTHYMKHQQRVEGSSTQSVSIRTKGRKSSAPSRTRHAVLTAFLTTNEAAYHKPVEVSQQQWLVLPGVQPITCKLEETGEKLCETDLSSTSKDKFHCTSTKLHDIEPNSLIGCTFELAATQIAIFVSVLVWRDPVSKTLVG